MANTDLMIDLETLATSSESAILTIGAVKFDPFSNILGDELYIKIDTDSCHDLGLEVNDDTINWWSLQSKEAIDEAFDPTDRIHIKDAFDKFYKFSWGSHRVWSNGAGFDVVICETIFKRLHRSIPWNFWQVRDVRTIFDLGINPKRAPVTAHNALIDAKEQAISVQHVCRSLKDLGITPFAKKVI